MQASGSPGSQDTNFTNTKSNQSNLFNFHSKKVQPITTGHIYLLTFLQSTLICVKFSPLQTRQLNPLFCLNKMIEITNLMEYPLF